MRVFLDANILFSASRSSGAVRELLARLHSDGHTLVADGYVGVEARRNLVNKAGADALAYLDALLREIEFHAFQYSAPDNAAANWLPTKDRPVLLAAMASKCDVLVTGDRTHFGAGFGKSFGGVEICAPAQLALRLW